ncbi:MAG: hypothetical protein K5756_05765 [Clostridiales bacterium]|nr:hypothetical protein [Clostridiales bacterium]
MDEDRIDYQANQSAQPYDQGGAPYQQAQPYNQGAAQYQQAQPYNQGGTPYQQAQPYNQGGTPYQQAQPYDQGAAQYQQGQFYNQGTAQYQQTQPYNQGAAQYQQGQFYNQGAAQYQYAQPYNQGPYQPAPQKKSNKGLIAVIIGVAVVILIVVIAILAGSGGNESAQNTYSGKTYTFEGVVVPIPDDFEVDDSSSLVIAKSKTYPNPSDSINFVKEGSWGLDGMSDSEVKSVFEQTFYSMYTGFSGIDSIDSKKISGKDAYVIKYDYTVSGVLCNITQIVIKISSSKCVVVTYGNISGSYEAFFEKSANNISIK